jgi:NB-ARC domain
LTYCLLAIIFLIVGAILNIQSITLGAIIISVLNAAPFLIKEAISSLSPAPKLSPDTAIDYSIVRQRPPADDKNILKRCRAVEEIYEVLIRPHIRTVILTGIAGVGKSYLASQIYQYVDEQLGHSNQPFTDKSIWIRISPTFTIPQMAKVLFDGLEEVLPDNFSSLTVEDQVSILLELLNKSKARLVVLDQFDNFLDNQTGRPPPDSPGISKWLNSIDSQKCRCRFLLTSRLLLQESSEDNPSMQMYLVKNLKVDEGIELLRKNDLRATEAELNEVVKRYDGHSFVLTQLASFMRDYDYSISIGSLFEEPSNAQLWRDRIARNLLDPIYKQQLKEVQRELILAFSVYRKPVPLDAARFIRNFTRMPPIEVNHALKVLRIHHLLQASGKDEKYYQLHAIVAEYARDHFVENDKQANMQALLKAHKRAAQYYQQQIVNFPPLEERLGKSTEHPLIEAVWQWFRAGESQEAYKLLEQRDISDFLL